MANNKIAALEVHSKKLTETEREWIGWVECERMARDCQIKGLPSAFIRHVKGRQRLLEKFYLALAKVPQVLTPTLNYCGIYILPSFKELSPLHHRNYLVLNERYLAFVLRGTKYIA